MLKVTVDLDDAQYRALKVLAGRRRTSIARLLRDLITSELASLPEADRRTAAEWTPGSARTVLGITGDVDPATRDRVSAAMTAAERDAEATYGTP